MAGTPQLVGPFPTGVDPDSYDRRRRRVLWALRGGLYVVGAKGARGRNLMTLNWATQVATEPKLVAVSVEAAAVTHGLIHEGRAFVLNILARADRAVVRKFVKPVEDDGNPASLGGFAVIAGRSGAPILDCAVSWLDCSLTEEVPCGSHTLFVGEVVDCGDIADGTEVLRMEDTRMNYGG